MSSKGKEIVEKFYNSDFYRDKDILSDFLHPEVELSWYGTTGLRILNFAEISDISLQLAQSFESLRADIEEIIEEASKVALHFTYHVKTIENPDEEMPLAHFAAIWELKDGKLYRGIQISQLGEEVEQTPWS